MMKKHKRRKWEIFWLSAGGRWVCVGERERERLSRGVDVGFRVEGHMVRPNGQFVKCKLIGRNGHLQLLGHATNHIRCKL